MFRVSDATYWRRPRFTGNEFHHGESDRPNPFRHILTPFVPEGRTLNLMCGKYGHVDSYVGLDISPRMLSGNADVENKLLGDVNNGDSLPFRDGAFDTTVIISGIAYITQPGALLAEVKRVLKAEGRAVIGFTGGYTMRAVKEWRKSSPEGRIAYVQHFLEGAGFIDIDHQRQQFASAHMPRLPLIFDLVLARTPL